MTYFPFYCDIENKKWLLVGGGRVAAGKFSRLIAFTRKITVIAPEISDEIKKDAEDGVRLLERDFRAADLDDADIVVAATDDKALNAQIASLCRERKIPVNAVDDPENCDFIFPAIIKRGRLTVSVSTNGASPIYAAMLKKQINDSLPVDIDIILEKMAALRKIVPERFPSLSQHERGMIYKKALSELLEDSGAEVDIEAIAAEIMKFH
jgi:siroheme synthase-like protein